MAATPLSLAVLQQFHVGLVISGETRWTGSPAVVPLLKGANMKRSFMGCALTWVLLVPASTPGMAQDLSQVPDSPDQGYYDWWIGRWQRESEGRIDTSATEFQVSRLPSGAILEQWRTRTDPKGFQATGVRSFDKAWNRWMYVWTSSQGHFQVWEERRVGDRWYIYREFDIAGDRYRAGCRKVRTG